MKRAITTAAILLLSACGDTEGQQEAAPSASKTIDSAGATLTFEGLTLEFPEGALSDPTEITVRRATPDENMLPGTRYELEPHGLHFEQLVNATIDFDASLWTEQFEPRIIKHVDGNVVLQRHLSYEPGKIAGQISRFSDVGTSLIGCAVRQPSAPTVEYLANRTVKVTWIYNQPVFGPAKNPSHMIVERSKPVYGRATPAADDWFQRGEDFPHDRTSNVVQLTANMVHVDTPPATGPGEGAPFYFYRVVAYHRYGASFCISAPSDSNGVYISAPDVAPSADTNLSATATGPDSVSLRWTSDPMDQSYLLERKTGSEDWSPIGGGELPSSDFSFEDTSGLQTDVTYEYRLQAKNEIGVGGWSHASATPSHAAASCRIAVLLYGSKNDLPESGYLNLDDGAAVMLRPSDCGDANVYTYRWYVGCGTNCGPDDEQLGTYTVTEVTGPTYVRMDVLDSDNQIVMGASVDLDVGNNNNPTSDIYTMVEFDPSARFFSVQAVTFRYVAAIDIVFDDAANIPGFHHVEWTIFRTDNDQAPTENGIGGGQIVEVIPDESDAGSSYWIAGGTFQPDTTYFVVASAYDANGVLLTKSHASMFEPR